MATKTKMQQPLTAPLAQRTDKLELARQALANSSLSIGAPGKSASTPSPLLSTTVLTIPIRDIGYYEKNPRTDPNESFEDIKESIRLAGLDSIMQVMRLPGATTYTVAKGAPAGGTAADPALHLSGAASVPQVRRQAHATTVEDALDKVIDAVAQFADACGIGETCKTSLSLPSGYVMEIPDEELTLPTESQADGRIRVAGWWMAATLARQYDEEHCRLLPADSVWRAAWVRDEKKLESSELFQVIQSHLGAVTRWWIASPSSTTWCA